MVTQVTPATLNQTIPTFYIQDIATSGQQIFLLDTLYVWSFAINAVQGTAQNIMGYGLEIPSYSIAVYQNGITTSVVLAQVYQIREVVVQSDTGAVISNQTYSNNYNLIQSRGVVLTANFLAVTLPNYVLVYQRGQYRYQDIFGIYGSAQSSSNYAFYVMENDLIVKVGTRYSNLYYLSTPFISASGIVLNDVWTLSATSYAGTAPPAVCIVNINVTNLGSNTSNWGIYQTNMGLPYSQSNNSITLTNNQTVNYNLGRSFVGWNIDYSIMNPMNGSNTVSIQKPSAQNLNYASGVPSPSNMIFMYSFGLSAYSFAYLLQDSNNNLWQQTCTVNGNNYNCVLTANYSLSGPLAAVAMQ